MVVDINGDARAYPLAILTWNEIVNDTVGGVPLVITCCPLCNSGLAFERTVDGPDGEEVLDLGTSGRLYRSNLVMYDRQHENLWTQFEGEAVVGEPFLGSQLTRVPPGCSGYTNSSSSTLTPTSCRGTPGSSATTAATPTPATTPGPVPVRR